MRRELNKFVNKAFDEDEVYRVEKNKELGGSSSKMVKS